MDEMLEILNSSIQLTPDIREAIQAEANIKLAVIHEKEK